MTRAELEQRAVEAVQMSQPEGEGFRVPYTFEDDFYGGSLVIVRFDLDGREVQNNVFIDDDGQPAVFWRTEDLAKALSGRRPITWQSRFLRPNGIAAVIALAVTMTICYLVLRNPEGEVPEILSTALVAILGFYFGTQTRNA